MLFGPEIGKGINDDTKDQVQNDDDDNEEEQHVVNDSEDEKRLLVGR